MDATGKKRKKCLTKVVVKNFTSVHITPKTSSTYTLRRNQDSGHLCTLEIGASLLNELKIESDTIALNQFLQSAMAIHQADKVVII